MALCDGHNLPTPFLRGALPDERGADGPALGPLGMLAVGRDSVTLDFITPQAARRYHTLLPLKHRHSARVPLHDGCLILGGVAWRDWAILDWGAWA